MFNQEENKNTKSMAATFERRQHLTEEQRELETRVKKKSINGR
jgi:hypothetical protein